MDRGSDGLVAPSNLRASCLPASCEGSSSATHSDGDTQTVFTLQALGLDADLFLQISLFTQVLILSLKSDLNPSRT